MKRLCLFAGYDCNGIVDDYVIEYVKELSKYSDVHYLADSDMADEELEKLTPFVISARANRHGEYDFGSYSRLLKNIVGWEEAVKYDEVLFVNDSCYLIGSLENVFAKMELKQCDWWGLQATKGISKTRYKYSNSFKKPIPLDIVKTRLMSKYQSETDFDFLIGSYFLGFRKSVITAQVFNNFIQSISKERNKLNIIRRYEIGLTKLLISNGFSFDTYMDHLYPFHPIFTEQYFKMVKNGFPLLKRFFLTQNHYSIPNLYQWEQRIKEIYPNLNVDVINRNLVRVCDERVLYESLHKYPKRFGRIKHMLWSMIKTIRFNFLCHRIICRLGLNNFFSKLYKFYVRLNPKFRMLDFFSDKDDRLWVFPVCAYDGSLSGNDLAVFEYIKNDNSIKKVILYRTKEIQVSGENVSQFSIHSKEAYKSLLKAGVVFIKHNTFANTLKPLKGTSRKIICLWHGIPLKRVGCAYLDFKQKLDKIKYFHNDYFFFATSMVAV